MKRVREEGEIEVIDMAKCLMLLSHGLYTKSINDKFYKNNVFECKTCNKQFTSFQALGGHRASHKKPRMLMGEDHTQNDNKVGSNLIKAKTHLCSICGLVFPVGQALGGHMRKHRDVVFSKTPLQKLVSLESNVELLKLDLNLTPLENDLKLLFGKMSPKVDHLIS